MVKNKILFGLGILFVVLPFISPYIVPSNLQSVDFVSKTVFRQCVKGNAFDSFVCINDCLPIPSISVDTGNGLVPYVFSQYNIAPSSAYTLSFKTNTNDMIYSSGNDIYIQYLPGAYVRYVQGGDCSTDPIPHFAENEVYQGSTLISPTIIPPQYPPPSPPSPPVNITQSQPQGVIGSAFVNPIIKVGGFSFQGYLSIAIGVILMIMGA